MKFNKIIYIRYFPLTERIYKDLYFEELEQEGFEVEYVDIKALFFPDKEMEEYNGSTKIVKLYSYKQLKKYLSVQTPDSLIISIMTFENRVIEVFKLLSNCSCSLAVFSRGVFPQLPKLSNEPVTDKRDKSINYYVKIFSVKNIVIVLKNLIKRVLSKSLKRYFEKDAIELKRKGIIKPYDFIFKAGKEGIRGLGHGFEIDKKASQLIEVNTVDYDLYLDNSNGGTIDYPYCVFLDQCLPYHPDAIALGIKRLDPERYYDELNAFFDKVERFYKIKVVVAAHPKAHIYEKNNPFNNRKFLFNATNELVSKSEFVLSHLSTSICFPVMYNKPLLFISSKEFIDILPIHDEMMAYLSRLLKVNMVYYDNRLVKFKDLKVDVDAYKEYSFKYITSKESGKCLSKDIFVNFLKQ